MRRIGQLWKLLWGCGCLACHLLNLILLGLACGQTGLIILNLFQKEVPLPDQFARWTLRNLGPQDLQIDWRNAVFDLRGGLLLEDVRISQRSTEQTLATAEAARLQWSPVHLIFPDFFPFSELQARGINLFLPVNHSPSGLNETALHIDQLDLIQDEGYLILRHLDIRAHQVHLHITGQAPLPLALPTARNPSTPSTATAPPDPASAYFNTLQFLRRIDPDFHIQAEAQIVLDEELSFSVLASVPRIVVTGGRLTDLESRLEAVWDGRRLRLTEGQVTGLGTLEGSLPEVPGLQDQATGDPYPFRLSLEGPERQWGPLWVPETLTLLADSSRHYERIQRVRLRATPGEEGTLAVLNLEGKHFAATAQAMLPHQPRWPLPQPDQLLPSSVDFDVQVINLQGFELFGKQAPDRILEGASAGQIRLIGTLSLTELNNPRLTGFTCVDDLFIGQTLFQHAATGIQLDRYSLALPAIEAVKNPGEFASGGYFHHFPSTRFSLIAAGAVFPHSLDNLLGRWWARIFRDIEASQPVPADVTVWGFWRDELSLRSVTAVDARGVSYKGAWIPELSLRVRSNEAWAWLEELEGRFGEGKRLSGQVALRSNLSEEEDYRGIRIDLKSTAGWEVVERASGVEALKMLSFRGGNPEVWARGVIWEDSGKGLEARTEALLDFGLRQPEGQCRVSGLELAGLNVTGQIREDRLLLEPITGEFAEGILSGTIAVENWQEEARQKRRYDLNLYDANYAPAIEQLSALASDPDEVNEPLIKGARQGRLDADLILNTEPDRTGNSGSGTVNLRKADIGRIHVFGGLSRFLDNLGLSFSTLDLNTLSLDWELRGHQLEVQRGLVSGPVLSLQMSGSVDIEKRELGLQADLTLFKGVVSKVLTPMSGNMQFDLVGTLENPEWRVRFTPFRWIGGRR